MSGIVLSASVRQNLLSLQSTASLLATTQNDLATGNKVNSALDNPTNFFTAQGLNNRASDINNLLDGIGNGVQVLQAANTGITSLQSLVSSAQSIANQVLQSPVGYTTKSNVTSTAITGATANNLLGSGTNATVSGTAVNNNLGTPVAITAATKLVSATTSDTLAATPATGSSFTVDGKTISFSTGQTTETTDASGNVTFGVGAGSTLTVGNVLSAIDNITGASTASTINAGALVLSTGTTQPLVIAAGATNALTYFGLSAGTTNLTPPALNGQTSRLPLPAAARRPTSPSEPAPGKSRRSMRSIPRWRRTTCRPALARPDRSTSRPPTTRLRRRSARLAGRLRQVVRLSTA